MSIRTTFAICLGAAIACLSSQALQAQGTASVDLGGRIDTLAGAALSRGVAGISIAVARNGQVIFARGYGLANLEHSVAVTPETVFHIDSISKNIASGAVLQLAEAGKLQLDDDVAKYVPSAPTHGRRVTVRQLLNHTSGIFSLTSLPDAEVNERRDLTHEQVLALFKGNPPDFEPGSQWRYNNSAFYLAGMVVERVTGQEYGAYVSKQIFQPLGMRSASLGDGRTVVPHLASGYEVVHGKIVNAAPMSWTLPFAAGGICASATDLLDWQAALDAGRVLSPSSLALMRGPTQLSDGTTIDYGLGTRLGSLAGHRVIGHTGSGGGFTTVLTSFPEDRLTIVVLMNTEAGPAMSIATAIAREALGLPKAKLLDQQVSAAERKSLPGSYDSDEGAVHLFIKDGKLLFRTSEQQEGMPLRRQAEYRYALDAIHEVHFLVREGHAPWAVVYAGGLMSDAKRRVD